MRDLIPPPAEAVRATHCTEEEYDILYRRSMEDPESFWLEQAGRIDWVREPLKAGDWSFDPVEVKWFEDGVLNLCFNCVDRHLATRADDTALIWEADEPGVTKSRSYGELYAEVVRMANCLKALGVAKGDHLHVEIAVAPALS